MRDGVSRMNGLNCEWVSFEIESVTDVERGVHGQEVELNLG